MDKLKRGAERVAMEALLGTLGGEGKQIHGMHPGFTLA